MPSDPAEVSSPKASLGLYFSAKRMGMRSPPRAKMVTPDPPVKQVKKAQTKAVTMAGPPLSHPKSA